MPIPGSRSGAGERRARGRAWEAALADPEPRLEARLTAEALKESWGMEDGAYERGKPETFDVDKALRLLTWREQRRLRRERERRRW